MMKPTSLTIVLQTIEVFEDKDGKNVEGQNSVNSHSLANDLSF